MPGKSILRLLSGAMGVLHSCGKDKPQASVTGDNDLPVCETSAERAHRCTLSWKHCIASSLERFDNKKIIILLKISWETIRKDQSHLISQGLIGLIPTHTDPRLYVYADRPLP